jgi:hypothetical protein
MSLTKVQKGLVTKYRATFATERTAWENKRFKPPANEPWLTYFFVPLSSVISTIGPQGYNEHQGYVQIDISIPADSGERDAHALFDKVEACFPPASAFIHEGQAISILSVTRSGGREVDGFYKISCTVRWKALITRNA